jgi:hypothetical protein
VQKHTLGALLFDERECAQRPDRALRDASLLPEAAARAMDAAATSERARAARREGSNVPHWPL